MGSMTRQQTIAAPVELEGIGLHTGAQVKMRLLPAVESTGRVFVRTDVEGRPEIPGRVDRVDTTPRGTNLASEDGVVVHTVEHVLAALSGCEVDNAIIELDGPEPPALDGSARPFVEAIDQAGIVPQKTSPEVFELMMPVHFRDGGAELVYLPSDDRLRITFNIDFKHPQLGMGTVSESLGDFRERVAPARTFCFDHEIEELRAQGLIQGGSLDNAVVLTEAGTLNDSALRFSDEPARHKLLDLIGDLSLVPGRIQGHIVAIRAGHTSNVKFAQELVRNRSVQGGGLHDIQKIMEILPHRYPLLLVDRVLELELGKRMVAIKNVTASEPHFLGHFPGQAVMPGVLILEAIAQASAYLLYRSREDFEGKMIYLAAIENARFRKIVVPGDQLRIEIFMRRMQRLSGVFGRVTVRGAVVCETELQAMVVDRSDAMGASQ